MFQQDTLLPRVEPHDDVGLPGPQRVVQLGRCAVHRENGGRWNVLLGPFAQHADALAQVEPVRAKAKELNDRAVWYGFGTVCMKDDFKKPALLNKYFPELGLAV